MAEASPVNAKKILVIEDDHVGGTMLRDYLSAHGYDVHWAKNGVEGVERARELHPDIVLCDVLLPRKSGFEVCFELKRPWADGERPPPIVLMSAVLERDAERRYATDLRADAYFVKPFKMGTMLARIEQLLGPGADATA